MDLPYGLVADVYMRGREEIGGEGVRGAARSQAELRNEGAHRRFRQPPRQRTAPLAEVERKHIVKVLEAWGFDVSAVVGVIGVHGIGGRGDH